MREFSKEMQLFDNTEGERQRSRFQPLVIISMLANIFHMLRGSVGPSSPVCNLQLLTREVLAHYNLHYNRFRVNFEILLFALIDINAFAPVNLSEVLHHYTPRPSVRFSWRFPKPGWSSDGTKSHIVEGRHFPQATVSSQRLAIVKCWPKKCLIYFVGNRDEFSLCPLITIVNKEAFCSISSHTSWVLGVLVTDIRLKKHLSVQKLAWFAAPECFGLVVPTVVHMWRRRGNRGKLVFHRNTIKMNIRSLKYGKVCICVWANIEKLKNTKCTHIQHPQNPRRRRRLVCFDLEY